MFLEQIIVLKRGVGKVHAQICIEFRFTQYSVHFPWRWHTLQTSKHIKYSCVLEIYLIFFLILQRCCDLLRLWQLEGDPSAVCHTSTQQPCKPTESYTATSSLLVQRGEVVGVVLRVSGVRNHPYDGAFQRSPLQQPLSDKVHVPWGVHAEPDRGAREKNSFVGQQQRETARYLNCTAGDHCPVFVF